MKKASGVEIAEYAGRRVDSPRGLQMLDRAGATLGCPFSGGACSKLSRSNGQHPVCSLRVNGDLYPVCTDRIIPAKSERQSQDHLVVLGQLAEALFPGVDPKSIAFKRQVSLSPKNRDSAGEGKTRATKLFLDFRVAVVSGNLVAYHVHLNDLLLLPTHSRRLQRLFWRHAHHKDPMFDLIPRQAGLSGPLRKS